MDDIMKFLASQGATVDDIKKHIEKLELVPGMEVVLQKICQLRVEDEDTKLVIISDANDVFIKAVLDKLTPPVVPDFVCTNLTQVSAQNGNNPDAEEIPYLKIIPYEHQKECPICPKNLCKGNAFLQYLRKEGPFDKVFYSGDGKNDVCPALKLGEVDVLFVRKGYGLEKCIASGKIQNESFKILAKIIYFEHGSEIEKEMFN